MEDLPWIPPSWVHPDASATITSTHLARYRSSAATKNTGLTSDNSILSSYLLQILQCSGSQPGEIRITNELSLEERRQEHQNQTQSCRIFHSKSAIAKVSCCLP